MTAERRLDRHFRWRGTEVTRMEALADAVFALVLALLFLQSSPPSSAAELAAALKALVPFAITFTLLAMVWVDHHRYFRRYGLIDKTTFFGNLLLLALVLFYAYPLKFLFTLLCVGLLGPIGELDAESMLVGMREFGSSNLMLVYSAGFGAIYATMALLYRHALVRADDLALDAAERHMTVTSIGACLVLVGAAVSSIVLALFGLVAASGFAYFAIGPAMSALYWRRSYTEERLVRERTAGESSARST